MSVTIISVYAAPSPTPSIETRTSLVQASQQSIFGYYVENAKTQTLSCNPGSTVATITTAKPTLFACQGQKPYSVCMAGISGVPTCGPGTLCCGQGTMAAKPSCGEYNFDGGKSVHYGCSQSSFSFIAYSTTPPTPTPIPQTGGSIDKGLLIGLIVGGVALLALILGLWFFSIRADSWRERRLEEKQAAEIPKMPAIAGDTRSLPSHEPAPDASESHRDWFRHQKARSMSRISHAFKHKASHRSPTEPRSPIPLQHIPPPLHQTRDLNQGSNAPAVSQSHKDRGIIAAPIPLPISKKAAVSPEASQGHKDRDILAGPVPVPLATRAPTTFSQSSSECRVSTYRIDHIPSTYPDFDSVKRLFNPMDRDQIVIRSLCPSAHYTRTGTQTATIEFRPFSRAYDLPSFCPGAEPQGVTVDKTFHGFTTLNVPTYPVQADIIAVTGFGSANAFKCFSETCSTWDQHFWLRDTLAKDFPSIRVMMYGHESTTGQESHLTFDEHAQEFENKLKILFKDQQARRPVIFIGHSTGGLLVKKALANFTNWGLGNFLTPISPLCIFIGVPHDGLDVEALYSLTLRKPPSRLVEELSAGSDTLEALQADFRDVSGSLQILSTSEQLPTKTAIEAEPGRWKLEGPETMIVSPASSRCWVPNERVIGSRSDHRNIAKFSPHNENYSEIYGAISRFVIPGSLTEPIS